MVKKHGHVIRPHIIKKVILDGELDALCGDGRGLQQNRDQYSSR